jgi:hypothetical protein
MACSGCSSMIQWPESLIAAAHIGCGKSNFCREAGAIGMITTNGQDRHRQFALGK